MLTTGSKLGPYEIVSPAGAGGMGEVEPICGRERSAVERERAGEILSQGEARVEGSLC
jgi:hypothetical protein